MNKRDHQNLKAESLAFFGSITASVTHELTNVIAIINELTGLLDDMYYAAKQGQIIEGDRLGNLHGRLSRQVNRGKEIVKRLNKFAHSSDHERIESDLNEILRNLVELMQRPADMKKIQLNYEPALEEFRLTANPFELQHLIFRCFRTLFDSAEENSAIKLRANRSGDNYVVTIDCPNISDESPISDDTELIRKLAAFQGWDLELKRDDGEFSFILSLPIAQM